MSELPLLDRMEAPAVQDNAPPAAAPVLPTVLVVANDNGPAVRTLGVVAHAYRTDPDSSYHAQRYWVRYSTDNMINRMIARFGSTPLNEINIRVIRAWYRAWSDNGIKVSAGHDLAKKLRTLFAFGSSYLEDADCLRLAGVMSHERFKGSKPNTELITLEQTIAVIARAHQRGWGSLGFGCAWQWETLQRQKDAIGEYVPLSEPGPETYCYGHLKWLHGAVWEEINSDLVLHHVTSKKGKPLEVNLRFAPLVMIELARVAGCAVEDLTRDKLPASGPMLINPWTGHPWSNNEYRRKFRICANDVGVPKSVKNMHHRAGGITEASEAGAHIEHIKHAATHSDIQMTQKYSRATSSKIEGVQLARFEHRQKQAANMNERKEPELVERLEASNDNFKRELEALMKKYSGGAA